MNSFNEAEDRWKDIIAATNKCKYEESIGLRNRLFIDLNEKKKLLGTLFSIKQVVTILFTRTRVYFSEVDRGRILFYFPYNTTAMFNNLYPIFQETQKKGMIGLIIKEKKIKQLNSTLYKEDIYKYTSFKIRVKYLFKSFNASNNLRICIKSTVKKKNIVYRYRFFSNVYHFYTIFLCQESFFQILSIVKPLSIISTSDYFPVDYALYSTANKLDIPNFVVQHGIVGVSYYPFTTSKLCVHGQYSFDILIRKGCPKNKLLISGMPSSDKLFQSIRLDKNVDNNKEIENILILSDTQGYSIYPSVYIKYIEVLEKLIESNPSFKWIIKLHPAESDLLYRGIVKMNKEKVLILPKETTLEEAFKMTDIAATIWSTAGLEAMISGLPLLIFDVNSEVYNYAWWPKLGGGLYISNCISEHDYKFKQINIDVVGLIEKQRLFLNNYFANKGLASLETTNYLLNEKTIN